MAKSRHKMLRLAQLEPKCYRLPNRQCDTAPSPDESIEQLLLCNGHRFPAPQLRVVYPALQ